jgi:hypothetical protein
MPPAAGSAKIEVFLPPSEGRGGGRIGGLLDAPTGAGETGLERSTPETGNLKTAGKPDEIHFDHLGRCSSSQNIIFENSRGKKKLVAVNPLGHISVVRIDSADDA